MLKYPKFFIGFSLFFVILYIPLSFTIYSSSWYEHNYKNQNIYSQLDVNIINNSTSNLINYFLHKEDLNLKYWTNDEITHYKDVRRIYDVLFLMFILTIIFTAFNYKNINHKYFRINLFILIPLNLILPIFPLFWNKFFHELLFRNNFWIMDSTELSFYLFPQNFFINSLILILIFAISINLMFYIIYKKYSKKK